MRCIILCVGELKCIFTKILPLRKESAMVTDELHNLNSEALVNNRKLKIGFFVDTYLPMLDGVIMVVDNYAKHLSQIADVTVFTTAIDKSFIDNLSYRVVRCKSARLPTLDYVLPLPDFDLNFKNELERANLDIVHIHSPFFVGQIGLRYAKKHNIPVIATIHSQYKSDFQRALRHEFLTNTAMQNVMKLYNSADECWTVNSGMCRIYQEEYGGSNTPKVHSNATDMLPCGNISDCRRKVNARYGLRDEEKVFLFVGRLNILKNILYIVDALKIVRENCVIPFKMLFVGSGQDEDKLRERIAEAGMEDSIILCGRINDRSELAAVYARADLFLFPSLYDANSLVQIEAASQGTPTLFLKGAVTGSSVTDKVNGFVADNSVEEYARKIIEIISDEELYSEVSEGAFRDLYKPWDTAVANVFSDYQRLVSESMNKKNNNSGGRSLVHKKRKMVNKS